METIDLKDYIRPLRHWWWLLLLAALIGAASTFAFASSQPTTYRSRGSFMIGGSINDPNPDSYDFYLAQQLVNTYADLISRESVRIPTMEALGMTWLPGYSTRVVPNTQLVEVLVTDTNPERAQAVAIELIRQLILVSPAGAENQDRTEFVNSQLDGLQNGIEETKAEIERRQTEMADMFSARQIADTERQIGALQSKLSSLQSNYGLLLSTTQEGASNTITVLERPGPGRPVSRNVPMQVLLAAAIGFVLAAGGAYLMEYLDDSMKNSDEVQKTLDVATLGAIPEFNKKEAQTELIMMEQGQSPIAESYRVLRTNLQFVTVAQSLDKLHITSALPNEGKSMIAANLALALAQGGRKVLLIDCDLHRPRQHRIFNLANNVGVTTALLSGETDFEPFLQASPLPNLRIMSTGPLPPNPAELLGSQAMSDMLDALQLHADMIILDSPPITAVADAAVLATQADGTLLVMHAGKIRKQQAKRAADALKQVGANIVGAVLNRMPSRGRGYYYYQYDYYRQYYRRDDNLVTTKNGVNGNGDYSGQPEPVTPTKTGAQTQQSGGLRTLVKRNPRPKSGSNGPANGHGNGNPSQSKDANGGDGSAT